MFFLRSIAGLYFLELLACVVISAGSLHAQGSPSEITFKLSTLSPDQVERLYTLVAPNYCVSDTGEVVTVNSPKSNVLKSRNSNDAIFNSSQLTVWRMASGSEDQKEETLVPVDTTISQAIGDDRYLIENSSTMIVVPGNISLTENDALKGMAQVDGVFEYITTSGAPRRIRKLRMIERKPLSKDAFIAEVKGGKTMCFVFKVPMKCPYCGGMGEVIGPPTGQYNDRFYIKCPDCKGTRVLPEGQLNKVVW